MLAQLCMIVDRISVMWNSGAWDLGYVDLLIRSFVTVFIISFSIDIDRSQLSAILPLCNYRRNATGSTCMATLTDRLLHMWNSYCRLRNQGLPLSVLIWPCRFWDILHEFWHLELHEFWSFLDTFKFVLWAPTRSGKLDGLRPGPASQFWCLDVEGFCMLRFSYCAVIGTRNLHYVMSHNF